MRLDWHMLVNSHKREYLQTWNVHHACHVSKRNFTNFAHVTKHEHDTKLAHVTVLSPATEFKKDKIHSKPIHDAEVACEAD